MELDALKEKWAEQDGRLDASLQLNRRFAWMAGTGAAFEFVGIILTGQFLAEHWDEPRFLGPALLLHGWLIAMFASAVRQVILVQGIDYGQPIAGIQRQLEELRVLRVRTTKWGLLTGQLVWWAPWLVVGMKGFFGGMPMRFLGFRMFWRIWLWGLG